MAKKETEKPATKQAGWLNKKDMAASLSISTQALDKWRVEPIAKIGRQTFFTVKEVVKNREENKLALQAGNNNHGGKVDPDEVEFQKLRKLTGEAEAIELKNEVTKRLQAQVILLEFALANIAEQVGSILDSIPGKVKKAIPHLKPAEVAVIEKEITKFRNIASKACLPWEELEESD